MLVLKESFNWVFKENLKMLLWMFFYILVISVIEKSLVNGALDTEGVNPTAVSQANVFWLSMIQNLKVLAITFFMCSYSMRSVNVKLGVWKQVKIQFYSVFAASVLGLFMALLASGVLSLILGDSEPEIRILITMFLFGLFMIVFYWHFFVMSIVRNKTSFMEKVLNSFSVFKHYKFVLGFMLLSFLTMLFSAAGATFVQSLVGNGYLSLVWELSLIHI